MDDDCVHGCGPKAHCVICNGRDARDAAARRLAAELRKGWWPPKPLDPPRVDRFLRARHHVRRGYDWNYRLLEDDADRYRGPGFARPVIYMEAAVLERRAS